MATVMAWEGATVTVAAILTISTAADTPKGFASRQPPLQL